MEENKEETNYSKLKWLKRIQEQSWEPEILISGIVLFALTQLPEFIRQFFSYLDSNSFAVFSYGTADEVLASVLLMANYWLISGFTIHLILRSVWVAFVGLSYVYKDGIQLDKLNYREQFKRTLKNNTNYVDNIVKLEKACSSVFAISFLLFMNVIGAFFSLSIAVVIIVFVFEVAPDFARENGDYIDPILTIVFGLALLDFIGLGILKRIPYVSKVYYPVYRFLSFITLSPLYRNIYYGFISNHKKWKVALAMAVFVAISVIMARSIRMDTQIFDSLSLRVESSDKYLMFHGHYENLMGENPSKRIQIPSDVIRDNVLPVFVVMNAGIQENFIKVSCDYDSLENIAGINTDSLHLMCLSQYYGLAINEDTLRPNYHYHEKQKTNQEGILTYLDIAHLPRGMHSLSLLHHIDDTTIRNFAVVEFYKDVDAIPTELPHQLEVSLPQDSAQLTVQD